ncbi:MAG: pectate lyase [Acidobacteria bacterium]|nr:pectate lyase [Acidobacteriota bacterium]MBI3658447.1 pectate lyase [Acidobacteriota bacterium]
MDTGLRLIISLFLIGVMSWSGMAAADDPLPAFPSAEGYGAFTLGGRGGDVYHVTNLNDNGPGSLRYGIQTADGPRTIVFDVSGTIELSSKLSINQPFLTLAGQTAPGDGITLSGWTASIANTHNVIVRYMRFRPGDINCPRLQDDSLNAVRATDVIIDHVSASWSIDETLSVTHSDRVTVQWSLITESLNDSCHEKGKHGYGSLLRYGNGGLTFHHNLYAHHSSRNPRVGDDLGLDFVNNVVYDWGQQAGYSGAIDEGTTRMNYVGNYAIAGPSTGPSRLTRVFNGGSVGTQIFQSGNLIDSNRDGIHDGVDTGWAMFTGSYTPMRCRFDFPIIQTEEAGSAYERVLANAGASLVRDPVDTRVLNQVIDEAGRIIDSQDEVGGWPQLESLPAPQDTDQDGMPDFWEEMFGLDPNDPEDRNGDFTGDGYTNLEKYINWIITGQVGMASQRPPSTEPQACNDR